MFTTDETTPCKTENAELWFSAKDDSKSTRQAIAWCRQCPVRQACADETLVFEAMLGEVNWGVYGGLTQSQRRKILSIRTARRHVVRRGA